MASDTFPASNQKYLTEAYLIFEFHLIVGYFNGIGQSHDYPNANRSLANDANQINWYQTPT